MLINKPLSTGDTVSFKLVNGDEIVANIVSSSETGWRISKPMLVVPSERGMGLMQALFTGDPDATMDLDRSSVLLYSLTVKDVASHYTRTVTGIELPR
jgi:hypothetical protein